MKHLPLLAPEAARSRLMIADDHAMLVESLCAALGPEFEIAGTAHSGLELLALVSARRAHCLVLDLLLPGPTGLELIPMVLTKQPALRILVISMLVDPVFADAVLAEGASGFVPKEAPMCELELAIREVIAGRCYVSARVPKTSHQVGLRARHPALRALTSRQEEILLLLGDGMTERDVAEALGLGPSTVTFHKRNLMRTLGIGTDAALRRFSVLVRHEGGRRD